MGVGRPSRLSRRELLTRAAASAVAVAGSRFVVGSPATNAAAQVTTAGDVVCGNGKFVDGGGQVATTLTIRNGRILNVGKGGALAPDARTIDLGGRTVVPGLFDAHVPYTRAGVIPGYEARRIERAFSIAELQEAIAERAKSVPPGAFITCIGGWNYTHFAEARQPTKAELDAAASKHAVYISGTGGGTGAITNSLGVTFFESKG